MKTAADSTASEQHAETSRKQRQLIKAIQRLRRAADEQLLICNSGSYGGNIAADIRTVLARLDH